MASGPAEPSVALLEAARLATRPWLRRLVITVTGDEIEGATSPPSQPVIDSIDSITTDVIAALDELLGSDVDEQTTTPLAIFRGATRSLTSVLVELGYPPVARDRFQAEQFPDDVYNLVPATWSDIDDALTEPALGWGAWKAMTILQRRRPPTDHRAD